MKRKRLAQYLANPKYCKQCGTMFVVNPRAKQFCNHSCATKYNNTHRPEGFKRGPSKGHVSPNRKLNPLRMISKISGPYSTLYSCTCKHCGTKWQNRTSVQYCDQHKELYSHNGRAMYWFTFSLRDHPSLFSGDLLRKHGMYSKTNPNGLTRDHRVSINNAIRNGYDPYYVRHPINCELMTFTDNIRKKANNSIAYEELVKQVDQYDNRV